MNTAPMNNSIERKLIRSSIALFLVSLLSLMILLPSCSKDDSVSPSSSSTGVDDHGSGGHGADDPQ
ncbi:MAG: hypothetical protein KA175_18350 [Flavobacteriales bacterium]|nr:hypothetical protein [Flavobacteriales bacterium]MBP6699588.1 hypothetical protein [Flavobacteriales bacterium]